VFLVIIAGDFASGSGKIRQLETAVTLLLAFNSRITILLDYDF
jgi:hypothetical protein